MITKRQITCMMAGATKAKRCASFNEVERLVAEAYPVPLCKHGAAGGWHWTTREDQETVVAASQHINAHPYGRHWLALRPKPASDAKKANRKKKVG